MTRCLVKSGDYVTFTYTFLIFGLCEQVAKHFLPNDKAKFDSNMHLKCQYI